MIYIYNLFNNFSNSIEIHIQLRIYIVFYLLYIYFHGIFNPLIDFLPNLLDIFSDKATLINLFLSSLNYSGEQVCRNSAVGTNSAMSHIGSVAAPYVADLLGAVIWWGPTTLCGGLALIAGLLCSILPETRGRPLANTVDEEVTEGRENVSFHNCCK